jgi:hypothetical protein
LGPQGKESGADGGWLVFEADPPLSGALHLQADEVKFRRQNSGSKFDSSHTEAYTRIAEETVWQTGTRSDRILRQSTASVIMDEYKASVQGVDNALARLNATLASYKISGNLPRKPAADPVTEFELVSASLVGDPRAVSEQALGQLKHHVFQVVSKVASEPVDWETWNAMTDEESLQKYPEVRFYNQLEMCFMFSVGSCILFRFTTMISDNS